MPTLQPKTIQTADAARQSILRGVNILANTVGATLGPGGRNVILDRLHGSPLSSRDGVTVAKEISLSDPYENMGAQLVKEVADKAARVAGDGTTTATVLAQAIYTEGVRLVASGSNPTLLKRGIDKATTALIGQRAADGTYSGGALAGFSQPVTTPDQIAQVGTISANSDLAIGKILAEAMTRVGKDGVVTVEEGKGLDTELEVVEGMQFDRGYLSPYFMTDAERQEVVLENPLILLTSKRASTAKDLLAAFQIAVNSQPRRPLLVIAEDIDTPALALLVVNRLQIGTLSCAVKAPGIGDRRKSLLEDLAVLTGATLLTDELGRKLEDATAADLGSCSRVVIDKDSTVVVGGAGDSAAIDRRISSLKQQILTTTSDYDRERLQERLAKLTGGVAVIKVGAATETEMKEKKMRVEDAMYATRAAVAEGIVPGGGSALLKASATDTYLALLASLAGDELIGAQIVTKACEAPLRRIVENAGEDATPKIDRLRHPERFVRSPGDDSLGFGYNAATGQYEDLLASGVIDPTKVTRTALQSAASIAGLMLTTEALVTDDLVALERVKKVWPEQYGPGGMMQR